MPNTQQESQQSSTEGKPAISNNSAQKPKGSINATESDKPWLTLEFKFDAKKWGEEIPRWNYQTDKLASGPELVELHQASLDRDTKQCAAWKEEVQNLLILAGLFSAVVTAFIIESYQTLSPNPNDQIISLLSRIADQTSVHSTNATSLPTASGFVPTSSSIRINILWFISLVLSLAVALIGIITLQWLREHQLYEPNTGIVKAFPILNARRDGLERWYVPQIFAALPVLLQAALVFFFFGLVEFLFPISVRVAVPVLVAVAIPILFLAATTIMPTLQLYSVHLPYLLRLNNNPPAPCPYKSPQSLLFQRVAIASTTLFNLSVWGFGAVYFPFIAIIRFFVKSDKPFYGESAPFSTTNDCYQRSCNRLRQVASKWISMDVQWLSTRTNYAMTVNTWTRGPLSRLQSPDYDAGAMAINGLYDCLTAIKSNFENSDPTDHVHRSTLYNAAQKLIFRIYSNFWEQLDQQASGDPEAASVLHAHITSCLRIITADNFQLYAKFVNLCRGSEQLLEHAFMGAFLSQGSGFEFDFAHRHALVRLSIHLRLIVLHTLKYGEELFLCSNSPVVTSKLFLATGHGQSLLQDRDHIVRSNQKWMEYCSRGCTQALKHLILDAQRTPPQQPFRRKCARSAITRCGSNLHTEPIVKLTEYFLLFQVPGDIQETIQLLRSLIESKPSKPIDPVQDYPLVLIIACAYVNAMANVHEDTSDQFKTLLHSICKACGSLDPTLEARPGGKGRHWPKMELAFDYIRSNCQQTSKEGAEFKALVETLDLPNNVGAEDNV